MVNHMPGTIAVPVSNLDPALPSTAAGALPVLWLAVNFHFLRSGKYCGTAARSLSMVHGSSRLAVALRVAATCDGVMNEARLPKLLRT